MSTLIGLSFRAGFMGKGGEIPGLDKALISDSVATMGAGLIGTPTSTAILESAVGIEAGARTGLCALFLAGFFVLTLFITPVLTLVPAFATACVLILVGYMMMQGTVTKINFHDISTGVPCFFTIFMMPFTFNIATGLGFGVISFVLLKLLCGKAKEISLTMAILAVVLRHSRVSLKCADLDKIAPASLDNNEHTDLLKRMFKNVGNRCRTYS